MLPYQNASTVYISTGEDKFSTLDKAIANAGFIAHLNKAFLLSGKSKEEYSIVIKANIMEAAVYEEDSSAYTDPALVERLINVLAGQGFKNIAIADAENLYNYKYQGRTVAEVAKMLGYKAANYTIIDLGKEQVSYDYGSVLGVHTVSKYWYKADYRISFGKNKTDWQCFYAGCLKNLYGCLPQWDRLKYYETKNITFYEACILAADQFPVHFGFLDAWASGDSSASSVKTPKKNLTKAIFASDNILALDWVQGEKMDMNPALNSVVQEAMLRWGTVNIVRKGNMTPWISWKNISYLAVGFWGFIEGNYRLNKFLVKLFMTKPDPKFRKV